MRISSLVSERAVASERVRVHRALIHSTRLPPAPPQIAHCSASSASTPTPPAAPTAVGSVRACTTSRTSCGATSRRCLTEGRSSRVSAQAGVGAVFSICEVVLTAGSGGGRCLSSWWHRGAPPRALLPTPLPQTSHACQGSSWRRASSSSGAQKSSTGWTRGSGGRPGSSAGSSSLGSCTGASSCRRAAQLAFNSRPSSAASSRPWAS